MTDRVPLADGPAWYACMTAPRQEGTAATGLRRAGLWPAYPLDRYQVRIRRAHGRTLVRWVDRPHFPRYVFLALRYAGESLAPAYSTKGVVNIVCRPISGEPLRIPTPVMDAILAERLVALDDDRSAVVMSETHLAGDSDLRVFLGALGRWRCERIGPVSRETILARR